MLPKKTMVTINKRRGTDSGVERTQSSFAGECENNGEKRVHLLCAPPNVL